MRPTTKFLFLAGTLALASPLAVAQKVAAVLSPAPEAEVAPVANAKPLTMAAIDALKGDGLYYFSGRRMVNLRISGSANGDRHPLVEAGADEVVRSFNGNLDLSNFLRDGERIPVGQPSFAVSTPDGGVQLVYPSRTPLSLKVNLRGYDVAGLPIRHFLRTPENFTQPEAARAGEATFPPGSIAYLATARFQDDVLVLPRRESFTGAANTRQMVSNFSRENPYCLSYDEREGARPYAILFRDASATRGRVQLYAAKPGTMFCARASEQVLAEGAWEEVSVGGTKAVVLSFDVNVNPLDTGVMEGEREAARIAFIEARKGTPGVRPGKLFKAGARIADYQYRFNAAAATAVRTALGAP